MGDADALIMIRIAPRPEHHRAEAKMTHLDATATKRAVFHRSSLYLPKILKLRPQEALSRQHVYRARSCIAIEPGSCLARNDLRRNAILLDDYFKLCQFVSIIQAGSNLFMGKIGKFSHDLLWAVAGCEIAKDQAHGNSGPFDTRFAAKNSRGAFDMILPRDVHARPHF